MRCWRGRCTISSSKSFWKRPTSLNVTYHAFDCLRKQVNFIKKGYDPGSAWHEQLLSGAKSDSTLINFGHVDASLEKMRPTDDVQASSPATTSALDKAMGFLNKYKKSDVRSLQKTATATSSALSRSGTAIDHSDGDVVDISSSSSGDEAARFLGERKQILEHEDAPRARAGKDKMPIDGDVTDHSPPTSVRSALCFPPAEELDTAISRPLDGRQVAASLFGLQLASNLLTADTSHGTMGSPAKKIDASTVGSTVNRPGSPRPGIGSERRPDVEQASSNASVTSEIFEQSEKALEHDEGVSQSSNVSFDECSSSNLLLEDSLLLSRRTTGDSAIENRKSGDTGRYENHKRVGERSDQTHDHEQPQLAQDVNLSFRSLVEHTAERLASLPPPEGAESADEASKDTESGEVQPKTELLQPDNDDEDEDDDDYSDDEFEDLEGAPDYQEKDTGTTSWDVVQKPIEQHGENAPDSVRPAGMRLAAGKPLGQRDEGSRPNFTNQQKSPRNTSTFGKSIAPAYHPLKAQGREIRQAWSETSSEREPTMVQTTNSATCPTKNLDSPTHTCTTANAIQDLPFDCHSSNHGHKRCGVAQAWGEGSPFTANKHEDDTCGPTERENLGNTVSGNVDTQIPRRSSKENIRSSKVMVKDENRNAICRVPIDRSEEVKCPERPLESDVRVMTRAETVATIEYACDPERGIEFRSFGTQVGCLSSSAFSRIEQRKVPVCTDAAFGNGGSIG